MNYFVFRNNTVERFFPKGFTFSGYDDISIIPKDVDGYVWFFQLPIKFSESVLAQELDSIGNKLNIVLDEIKPSKPFIVFTIEGPANISYTSSSLLIEAINRYNYTLLDAEKRYPNVRLLDITEFTRQYPSDELIDWKYWFISQMGMNPRLAKPFQVWFNRKIDQINLKRKKCLVLDLDNTIWGGILGEDGMEGIQISGDYPGKAFHYFQEVLLELEQNGVILTICSKNNESDVLEVFEKNPFIVLRKEHFSTWRINWNDKATNIREIAGELNIGLDSFVFVDDNPSERELIRQALPMVAVPDFPEQPYNLPSFCKSLVENYFRVYAITNEDKEKTAQYKANAQRSLSQKSFTDMESFIESLKIRIDIEQANQFNIPRIAQMTQKTNQFNLTTKRYTEADILSHLNDGWKVYCMSVSDRFGDNGITGCILINHNEIDSLLLSCRILGKGIEYAFLNKVMALLKEEGVKTLTARFIPSPKNSQVKDFYESCGFTLLNETDTSEKIYSINLDTVELSIKSYFEISYKENT